MRITKRDFFKLQTGISISKKSVSKGQMPVGEQFFNIDVIVVKNINYHLEFRIFLVRNFDYLYC